jgi:hypothetical protein
MNFETIAKDYHHDFHATFDWKDYETKMNFDEFSTKWGDYIRDHFPIVSKQDLRNMQVCYGLAYVIMSKNKRLYKLSAEMHNTNDNQNEIDNMKDNMKKHSQKTAQ